jgi:hypothetical protein
MQLARVLLFVYYFIHMYFHYDQVCTLVYPWALPISLTQKMARGFKLMIESIHIDGIIVAQQVRQVHDTGYYFLVSAPVVLGFMNLMWFFKILQALNRTLKRKQAP